MRRKGRPPLPRSAQPLPEISQRACVNGFSPTRARPAVAATPSSPLRAARMLASDSQFPPECAATLQEVRAFTPMGNDTKAFLSVSYVGTQARHPLLLDSANRGNGSVLGNSAWENAHSCHQLFLAGPRAVRASNQLNAALVSRTSPTIPIGIPTARKTCRTRGKLHLSQRISPVPSVMALVIAPRRPHTHVTGLSAATLGRSCAGFSANCRLHFAAVRDISQISTCTDRERIVWIAVSNEFPSTLAAPFRRAAV